MLEYLRYICISTLLTGMTIAFAEEYAVFPASTATTNPSVITNILQENPNWLTILAYTPEATILVGPITRRVPTETRTITNDTHDIHLELTFTETNRESTLATLERLDLQHETTNDNITIGPLPTLSDAQKTEYMLRTNAFVGLTRIIVTERSAVVAPDPEQALSNVSVPPNTTPGSYQVITGDAAALESVLGSIAPGTVPLRVVWVGIQPSLWVGPLGVEGSYDISLPPNATAVTVVVPEEAVVDVNAVTAPAPPPTPPSPATLTIPTEAPAPATERTNPTEATPAPTGTQVFVTTTRDPRAAAFVVSRLQDGGFIVHHEVLDGRHRVSVIADSLADAQVMIGRLRDFGYLAYVMGDIPRTRVNTNNVTATAETTIEPTPEVNAITEPPDVTTPETPTSTIAPTPRTEPTNPAASTVTTPDAVERTRTPASAPEAPTMTPIERPEPELDNQPITAHDASEERTPDRVLPPAEIPSVVTAADEHRSEASTEEEPARDTTIPPTEAPRHSDTLGTDLIPTPTPEMMTQQDRRIMNAIEQATAPLTEAATNPNYLDDGTQLDPAPTRTTTEEPQEQNVDSTPERSVQYVTRVPTTDQTYLRFTTVTTIQDVNTLTHAIPTELHPITITRENDQYAAFLGPFDSGDAIIIANELENLTYPTSTYPSGESDVAEGTELLTGSEDDTQERVNGMRVIELADTLGGTFLQLTTSSDPDRLTDERDILTSLGYTPYVLIRSDRYALVIGPLDDMNVNELRRELRRSGIPSFPLNEPQGNLRDYLRNPPRVNAATPTSTTPDTTVTAARPVAPTEPTNEPTTTQITAPAPPKLTIIDLTTLTHPRNYLRLTPHDPNNPPELPPNTLSGTLDNQTIHLIGPIPNEDLQTTADNLDYPGIITTHPMPAPQNVPPGAESITWSTTGYERLHLNAIPEAREAFIEALYWDVTHRDTLLGLAITEHQTNDTNAAAFAYEYLLRHHPNDLDGNYNYGILKISTGDPQGSITNLTTAINAAQGRGEPLWIARTHLMLGHALTDLNQHDQAAQAYATAQTHAPNNDTLLHQYNAHLRAGRTLELLPELTIHERNTNDPRFTHLITQIYLRENQPTFALDTLNRRINRNPNRNDPNLITLYTTKADIHTNQNNLREATRSWETILLIDPTNETAFNNIITLNLMNDNPHTAKHRILTNPQFDTNPTTLTLLLEAAHRTNDTNLLTTLMTNPNIPTTPRNDLILANHACNTSAYPTCFTFTTRILTVTPNDTYAVALHAEAAYETGDYATSINHYQQLIDMNIDAREHLATAQLAAGEFQAAKTTLIPLTNEDPTNANALHMLGWTQLRTNEIEQARQTWLKAIALQHEPSITDHARVFNPKNPN